MSSSRDPALIVSTAPFLRTEVTTPGIMRDVIYALLPTLVAAWWFFGGRALLVVGMAIGGCVLTEWAFSPKRPRWVSLWDGSAVLTGLLLGLILPPAFPLWMAFLGGVVGIGLGKVIWGGLGDNLFNPALVGRAFLQAAFPTAITTWTLPSIELGGLKLDLIDKAQWIPSVDAISGATPLGAMKFDGKTTESMLMLLGDVGGSLGETSALLIILGGIYLVWRRAFDWRIPVSILGTVAVLSGALWGLGVDKCPSPIFMLLSGGLLFGAVFMATDPVTSPLAPRGAWIFGFGVGALVVLIRVFGGLPEGVMYAILLMNAASPLIERYVQQRPLGRGRRIA